AAAPARAPLGRQANRRDVAEWRRRLGLDEPLPVQFGFWFGKVVTGNLGYSLQQRIPVTELLANRLQNTLLLTVAALTISVTLGVAAGVVSAARAGSLADRAV